MNSNNTYTDLICSMTSTSQLFVALISAPCHLEYFLFKETGSSIKYRSKQMISYDMKPEGRQFWG